MLIVKVFGGLGNQLFQYAFYLYLLENNKEVLLDITDFKTHNHHNGFELYKIVGRDYKEASENDISHIAIKHNNFIKRAVEKLLACFITKKTEYVELSDFSMVYHEEIPKDVYFRGLWQDVTYVCTVEDKLRALFSEHGMLNERNKEFLKKYDGRMITSVHIRRGDYIGNASLGNICDEQYYNRAVHYIKEGFSDMIFFIFSDDITWCRERYKGREFVFIDWNQGSESYQDMILMAQCHNNIIANSTFSWWAAWFNPHEKKVVVMPSKWKNKGGNSKRLSIKNSVTV